MTREALEVGAFACGSEPQGLWRTTLAGPGQSLVDAFANLEKSKKVQRMQRHVKRNILSARVALTPEEGQGYWELAQIRDGLYVILSNFTYKNPRFEIVPGDGLVQFNFKISGDITYVIARPGPLRFNRPCLQVWRQPKGIDMREWTAPFAHERVVGINVRPEFLVEHFLPSGAEIPARLKAFISPPGDQIGHCQMPLTQQMVDITNKLLDNPYKGELALAYTEALTLELLCIAIGELCSLSALPSGEYAESELRALEVARRLLMERLTPAPTLEEIAREVGLAERALTRGFKAVYGHTLFDFSLRCRMQHAFALLRDRHWPVDRVSETIGYCHPTSFATAFRRHFGMRPVDVKRPKARLAE